MNINLNAQNLNNYRQKTNFKSGYHNARTLQNIPGINCACCGRKMISLDSIAKTFSEVTKPLAEMLNKGVLDRWKEVPFLLNIIQRLAAQYPNDSLDKIVQRSQEDFSVIKYSFAEDVKRTYPENTLLQNKHISKQVYKSFLYDSRKELENASSTINKFSKFKKYLKGAPLEAFEQLQIYAQKYPQKRLSEIVQLDEVYEYHKVQNELLIQKFNEKLDFHFHNILKMALNEDPLALQFFTHTEKKAREIMLKDKDADARKLRIKMCYEKALKFIKCEAIHDAVMNEIDQMPVKYPRENAFFVTAHDNKWNDAIIIKNIFDPFCGTLEHVIPKSKGGEDNIYNAIIMCKECNSARNNKDYHIHIKFHPKMPKYIQKQINYVEKGIISGQIKEETLVRWPVKIAANLKYYTGGLIAPQIGDYCAQAYELTQKKCSANLDRIESIENENAALSAKKEELERKIKDISLTVEKNNQQIEQTKIWIGKNKKDLEFFKRNISSDLPTKTSEDLQDLEEHEDFPDNF